MTKNDIGGVWRTIGGRRVFIKDGQDLATAMKESGKFKKGTKYENKHGGKIEIDNYTKDGQPQYKESTGEVKKTTDDESLLRILKDNGYNKVDEIEKNKKLSEKEFADKIREIQDRPSYKEKMDKAVQELNEKYGYNNQNNNRQKQIEANRPNEMFGESKKEKANNYFKQTLQRNEKIGNDFLPKESEIKDQGKSNRAEVSNNIQAHILSYYDNPVDFMEQMDAMDYLPTKWKAGEEIAKGGSYLIYNQDMSDYLDKLKINPKGKKFSEDRTFQIYTSLVGRESEKLYNRLEKLYNEYKQEHKNSNVSLSDFRKWFK